ncbi:hypothetical protein BC831DRAFT_515286 [Entophlyctis helioformis]|nr:hypothetical protein BC831DRAFT_515286 [Entophlyctis helioformis]
MLGLNDPCYGAYEACSRSNGQGYISTLADLRPPVNDTTARTNDGGSPLPVCPPGYIWGSDAPVCSSVCYTCGGILNDFGSSFTYASPDLECQTLRYACTLGCGPLGGVVPLCLRNSGTTPSGASSSIGTCICRSQIDPDIALPRAQLQPNVRLCQGVLIGNPADTVKSAAVHSLPRPHPREARLGVLGHAVVALALTAMAALAL